MQTFVRIGTDLVLSHANMEECLCQEGLKYFCEDNKNFSPSAILEENQAKTIQMVVPIIVLGLLSSKQSIILEAISSTLESQLTSIVEKNQILEWLKENSTMEKITEKIICLNIPSLRKLQSSQVTYFSCMIIYFFYFQFNS